VRRRRRDIGPRVSNQDHSTVVILLIEKFAESILKLTDDSRQTQDAFGRVAPVETPLMRLRIVKSQRQTLDVRLPVRAVDLDLIKVCAIPNLSAARMTFEFYPGVGAGQRVLQFFQMKLPVAKSEIEIVPPVAQ
jgi:hypothetical protein